MEFKGTSNTWFVSPHYKREIVTICDDGEELIAVVAAPATEKGDKIAFANALLISKAPEMLEMLKIARDKFLCLKHDSNMPELQVMQDIIEELIKDATEVR